MTPLITQMHMRTLLQSLLKPTPVIQDLREEINATLMWMCETDLKLYGYIPLITVECFEEQNQAFPKEWVFLVKQEPNTIAHKVKQVAFEKYLDKAAQEEYMTENGIPFAESELVNGDGDFLAHLFVFSDKSALKVLWEVFKDDDQEQFQAVNHYLLLQ